MEKMIFEADRTRVEEGGVVEITWDCHEAERVELTINNGYRASTLQLEGVGKKRFRLNRSKGRTALTITATVGGKQYSKCIKVKVTEIPRVEAEEVDEHGRPIGEVAHWWKRVSPRLRTAGRKVRAVWEKVPRKQRVWLWLAVVLLIWIFIPKAVVVLALVGFVVILAIQLLRYLNRKA